MYILEEVCYMITSFPAIPFFYDRVVLSSDSYVTDTVFISQQALQPSIITSGLWLIGENQKMDSMGMPLQTW